jgi:hypothetical protein
MFSPIQVTPGPPIMLVDPGPLLPDWTLFLVPIIAAMLWLWACNGWPVLRRAAE